MDEGKPAGSKAKWWSRPARTGDRSTDAPEAAVHAASDQPDQPGRIAQQSPEQQAPEQQAPEQQAPEEQAAEQQAPEQYASESAGRTRPQPLHAPDPYGTPPYGGPGPWAPAPPVQRPVPTPPQGTFVPPGAPATNGAGIPGPAHAPAPAPLPVSPPHNQQPHQPHPHQPSQWLQYDPWGAIQQPLTHPGAPGGASKRKGRGARLFVGALLIALVAGGIGGGVGAYIERNGGITRVELPQAAKADGKARPADSVAGIAASALPGVVTLHVSGAGEQGTGTGFVLDAQGHILTNHHVVEPAGASGNITVTFSGGETAKAKVIGKDSGYDLAVVQVTGVDGLRPLPLGNSENVQVGDPVVAIGAPFDLQNTVTSGIISAKERPITAGGEKGDGSDVSYVNALQTDAPINPGNSGGPLLDGKANVIGINSAIRAAGNGTGLEGGQGGSIGLGFAIPINQGKRVAEELINTGRATHPVIGVTLDMKYTGDGARVGTKGAKGPAVTPGGAGAKAGIEPRDIITEVDGQRVHNGQELIVKIRSHRPGDRLQLTVVREGEERSVTVTLGSADGT
ncbi:trypsin-like peptidase domain-containing protein [Streptomyces sp. ISL-98]|uniref:S1C family serine protease n=1 Tax=Streptomyces sp. ISL-98 TaxID=2819192 RepID=UPI001BE915FB|nr:trypsin-like peptidase domain-containing protein [Streptomyces sp. ISL-98]MBT2506217.1 trypsin-like peptidase domain-containing protein [Streptomyces sp. ISL-98]